MVKRTLICRCSHRQLLEAEALDAIVAERHAAGEACYMVDDLCELCGDHDPALKAWVADGEVEVVACHPRAVQWLLHQAGIPATAISKIHDLREGAGVRGKESGVRSQEAGGRDQGSGVRDQASGVRSQESGVRDQGSGIIPPNNQQPATNNSPSPWFPVIDYARCTGCKQCLSFCPFGVYSRSEDDGVEVTSPRNCKNNCPACARICPQMAIIFPKFKQGPISGEPVTPEDVARVQAVLAEQADGELHDLLAKRKLRAAYRKLERLAGEQQRELTQDELAEAMARATSAEAEGTR
jgi:ferredoxin